MGAAGAQLASLIASGTRVGSLCPRKGGHIHRLQHENFRIYLSLGGAQAFQRELAK